MKSINCPNCGNRINEGARFCGACGQKVIQPTDHIKVDPNLCPKCNREFEKDENFCAECGTSIDKNIVKNIQTQQKEQVQERQPKPTSTLKQNPSKKKEKGSILKTLGKIVLGFIAFVILGSILLYNLGDDTEDAQITQEEVIDNPNNVEKENTVNNEIDVNDKNSAEQYRYGIDVQPNQYKAFELYKKLADKGDLNAMVELSDYYEQGIWVKKDIKKARKLLQKAADAGSLPAKWQLEFLESEQ